MKSTRRVRLRMETKSGVDWSVYDYAIAVFVGTIGWAAVFAVVELFR